VGGCPLHPERRLTVATVALFGDSTYWTGYLQSSQNAALVTYHGKAADYDGRLHQLLKAELALLGVTVDTTNHAIRGMDSSEALTAGFGGTNPSPWGACKASAPDVVIINFGANDHNAPVAIETFTSNIQTMIDEAEAAGIVPVLATPNWVDYPTHHNYDRNTSLDPYAEALIALAVANGLTLIDIRFALYNGIRATWDLFAHNDATYYSIWENGTEPPDAAYYTNIHGWLLGAALMAQTMALRLHRHEPLLGGTAGLSDRSSGRAVADFSTPILVLKAV
jgi:lysophospholipase L1-like esterase